MSASNEKTVSLSATRIPPDAQGAPLLEVHGDPDDHLRLSVLLADLFATRATNSTSRDAAADCKSPKTTWPRRLDALRELAENTPPVVDSYFAILIDIDGLDRGPPNNEQLWDDRDFYQQRRKLLDEVLISSMERFKFLLMRPRPSLSVSTKMAGLVDEREDDAAAEPSLLPFISVLSPESQPILRWIVEKNALQLQDVEELFDACEGQEGQFERSVLSIAYEKMPPSARSAAKRLSAVRGVQHHNGNLGPFTLEQNPSGDQTEALFARGVQALEDCGFLQATGTQQHSALRMPRAARGMLRPLAQLGEPEAIEAIHKRLSEMSFDRAPRSQQLEIHYHAIQSQDLERALATSVYYGADLRAMAFRMSREGRHDESAALYKIIVDRFDPQDAYAWEYFAYNLALAHDQGLPESSATAIHSAYQRAHELDRHNPLYHGRFLGFRATQGEDISAEFGRVLARYQRESGERLDAISYFAEPVLNGLQRGRQHRRRRELLAQWGTVLQHAPRLRPFLGSDV